MLLYVQGDRTTDRLETRCPGHPPRSSHKVQGFIELFELLSSESCHFVRCCFRPTETVRTVAINGTIRDGEPRTHTASSSTQAPEQLFEPAFRSFTSRHRWKEWVLQWSDPLVRTKVDLYIIVYLLRLWCFTSTETVYGLLGLGLYINQPCSTSQWWSVENYIYILYMQEAVSGRDLFPATMQVCAQWFQWIQWTPPPN